jgi:hypothetical protein
MTRKGVFKPTVRHRTTLATISDKRMTVCFYGKPVDGIDLSTSGLVLQHPSQQGGTLKAAEVYGAFKDGGCITFQPPRLCLLPDPVGPADGCAWNPAEFVVWKVPADWSMIYFDVKSSSAGDSLAHVASTQTKLSSGQSLGIASDCLFDETGNPQPIDRGRTLQSYGINDPEQSSGVRTRIVNSPTLGVQRYGFRIDANDLKDLSGGWTLGQLADRIQDSAVPS